jgi:hypothetical protein
MTCHRLFVSNILCVYVCRLSWSRGKELDCISLGRGFEPRIMSGTPVITHRSGAHDWLAQFSITSVHKCGPKLYSFQMFVVIHVIILKRAVRM